MQITVVQPDYLIGENPDKQNCEFIIKQLKYTPTNGLILFPEYSNAGGISSPEQEKAAMRYAKDILEAASNAAKEHSAFVAVNVLEQRGEKIKNSTYLFNKNGETAFVYDKQHLPPSEVKLGVEAGTENYPCRCICDCDGLRFAFLTCYDVYFNEQIEYIAKQKPDIILLPGLQRGERRDILKAQTKMIAFRCNAYVVKSSFSMKSNKFGGCSMIVKPDGKILKNMGSDVGNAPVDVDLSYKYYRAAGYGESPIRNDDFINSGLCPNVFERT